MSDNDTSGVFDDKRKTALTKFSPPTPIGRFVLGEMKARHLSIKETTIYAGVEYYTLYRLLETKVNVSLDVLWSLSINFHVDLRILIMLARPDYVKGLTEQEGWFGADPDSLERILSIEDLPIETANAIKLIAKVDQARSTSSER